MMSRSSGDARCGNDQWRAFVGKGKLDTGRAGLNEIVDTLRGFLMPPAKAVATGGVLNMVWPAVGPWQPL